MKLVIVILFGISCLTSTGRAQDVTTQPVRDTVYYLLPFIVNPTTARERETPATFSNLTEEQISERYSVQDIPVLLSELPSITTYSENGNGIGYNYINLRGFDQRRISVMVNGVPQNDPEDHNVYWIDLPDLLASTGGVQVQRGAGSAFYGPPAIGGSVNIVTNPFSRTPGVTLESIFGIQEFGDRDDPLVLNTRKFSVSAQSGLVDRRYMIYGRLSRLTSGGYRNNAWVEMDSYFLGAVRFDPNMTTRLHFFGGPIADGLVYYGLPKFSADNKRLRKENLTYWEVAPDGRSYDAAVRRRPQEVENFSQPHYELLHEWRLTPSITLHNTLFYYVGEGYFDYDASWADTSTLRIGSAYGFPTSRNPSNSLVRGHVHNRQAGWLPRIEIGHKQGELIAGLEIRRHRSTHWGKIQYAEDLPPQFDPDYRFYEYNGEKDILSFYIHELYRPRENVTLMANLQFVRNRCGIRNEKYLDNSFDVPYFFVNPRVGVNFNIDDRWNTYLSLGYTSREPRMRNLYAAEDSYFGATPQFQADTTGGTVRYNFDEPLAKPERLVDIEMGLGYRTATARLFTNIFWMEFTDELVKSGQVDIFGQPVTGNAERTRHIGVEVDGEIRISDRFLLGGNFTLSSNRLVRYSVIEDGKRVTLDDNPIAGFPDALGNIRLTYRTDGLVASLTGKYVGPFYTDNFKREDHRNDAYHVYNGEILYTLPRFFDAEFTMRGEVRNIFNRLYFMNGEGDAFFPAAERNYIVGVTAKF